MNYRKRVYTLVLCALVGTAALTAQTTGNETVEEETGRKSAVSAEETQGFDAESGQDAGVLNSEAESEQGQGAMSSTGPADSGEVNEEDLAIEDSDSPAVQMEGGLNSFSVWDFLRMFLVLGGVIASIYGVFFFLKKMGNPKYQSNNLISVLSTQNLQSNRALHLVEIGNEVFLVGSSEGGVELVGKIEEQETLDRIRLYRSEMNAGGGKSFQQSLRDMFFGLSGRDGTEQGESSSGGSANVSGTQAEGGFGRSAQGGFFIQKQRERLKNL